MRRLLLFILLLFASLFASNARESKKTQLTPEEHIKRAEQYYKKKDFWQTLWHYDKARMKVKSKGKAKELVKIMNRIFWEAIVYKIENKQITTTTGAVTFLEGRIEKKKKEKLDHKDATEVLKMLQQKQYNNAMERIRKILEKENSDGDK